jgi:hypothetical protein
MRHILDSKCRGNFMIIKMRYGKMKNGKFTVLLIVAFTTFFLFAQNASSQSSVSIGDGFDCFTDIDGSKTLGKLESTGFKKVKFAAVEAKVERDLGALDVKEDRLKAISRKEPGLFETLLVGFVRLFVARFPDLNISTDFDNDVQRDALVQGIKDYTKQHRIALHATVRLARKCKGGTTKPPQNGSTISPTIKLVSFRGGQSAYAGFLVLTTPRIPKFATKPGGFNVCTRIQFPAEGPEISGIYTGVGTDLCYIGGAIVDDNAVAACNATLPSGFVGLFLKKAEGTDLSDEGLKNLESLIVGDTPTITLLALDQFTGSRDEAVERCEQFKQ